MEAMARPVPPDGNDAGHPSRQGGLMGKHSRQVGQRSQRHDIQAALLQRLLQDALGVEAAAIFETLRRSGTATLEDGNGCGHGPPGAACAAAQCLHQRASHLASFCNRRVAEDCRDAGDLDVGCTRR